MTVAPGLESIALVRFAGKKKPEGRVERLPWDILVGRLLKHAIRDEKDGPAFSPTIYHEGPIYRDAENVRALTLVVLDIDDGTPLAELRDRIAGFDWVAYTTHSNTTAHPKYRLVFRLHAPVPVERWRQVWRGAAELLAPGHVDQSCKGAERLYFYPSCPEERKGEAWAVRNIGGALDPEHLAAAAPPEPERISTRNGAAPLTGTGDYRTLDVVQWFESHGAYGKPVGGGRHAVSCPWMDQHTKATPATDSDAVVWEATPGRWPSFYCSHNSCVGRGIRDVLAAWGDADRWCSQPFRPMVAALNGCACSEDAFDDPPADDWEPPLDLFEAALPAFPVEVLPVWLGAMVLGVSRATQTPVDLPAMLGLSVLSLACQKRVEVWVRPDWQEPVSLWTVSALGSGEAKTPVFGHMVSPIAAYEAELTESMRAEVAENSVAGEVLEGRIKRLQQQASREDNLFERQRLTAEASEIAAELARTPVIMAPRFLADDVTPERLAILMSEQNERMAILADEAGVFEIMAGRYTQGRTNFTFYLKAHSGSMHPVDRVNRPSIVLRRPALVMGLTCQPQVLIKLSENPEFRERGLLARFLFSVPPSMVGHRDTDAGPLESGIAAEYARKLRALLELPGGQDDAGRPASHALLLSDAARELFATFRRTIEPDLGDQGRLSPIGDWGGKLPGTLVRIAALLHLAERAGQEKPWEERIQDETLTAAVTISQYLIEHALGAFRMIGSDPAVLSARKIAYWLRRHKKRQVTVRDLHLWMKGTFKTVDELDRPLRILIDHRYLRAVEVERKQGAGRPASPVFEVHPIVLDETSDLL